LRTALASIEVLDTDTGGLRQVVPPRDFLGDVAWSPDGRSLAFREQQIEGVEIIGARSRSPAVEQSLADAGIEVSRVPGATDRYATSAPMAGYGVELGLALQTAWAATGTN